MIQRWRTLHSNMGAVAFYKTVLMLVALVICSAMGFYFFSSPASTITAVACVALGATFRSLFMWLADYYTAVMRVGLFVYFLVLFLGRYYPWFTNDMKLVIITATTAMVFNLNFWGFSQQNFRSGW